jgi:hypothetical protein
MRPLGSTILYMAIPNRHGSDKGRKDKRLFSGEKESQPLVALLNAKDGAFGRRTAASRRRVGELFETVFAMLSMTKETPSHLLSLRDDRKYESLIRSLNRKLKRYRESRFPFFGSAHSLAHGKESWWFDYERRTPGVPEIERAAIDAFVDLGEEGLIGRIRRCQHCQRWIFARFPHQSCCSAYCRERVFRSSEQWKAKRREKAKEYYWLHKNKNVK